MTGPFASITPTPDEVAAPRPGDDVVDPAAVVMDRAFTVGQPPDVVWPWLVQLGKGRAGWYLPRKLETLLPRSRRALRHIEPRWQRLRVGDVIPDYGGRDATFEVAELRAPSYLVFFSRRGRTRISWTLHLSAAPEGTRVHLRLRLGPVKHARLADKLGGAFDALTIAGLAAGLEERVSRQ